MTRRSRTWTLLSAEGSPYESSAPGTVGGNAKDRIYGRLDCGSALAALRRGGYAEHRVFFADAETARAAGYRPCGNCLRAEYAEWKANRS